MSSEKIFADPYDNATYTQKFSPRETEVLSRLVHGTCNKLIARDLGIADSTVKVHVKSLLRKLRLVNRTQAAVWASNNGFGQHIDHLQHIDDLWMAC
jgi:two-component system, NarL family, nitrate/nitrite response regulator NarL